MGPTGYTVVRTFHRLEAIHREGANYGQIADPVKLYVALFRDEDDENAEPLEELHAGSSEAARRLVRRRKGAWVYTLPTELLEYGKSYTVRWHFSMVRNANAMDHQSFVWMPVPETPIDPEKVVVWGQLTDPADDPHPNQDIVIETYADFATLARRTGEIAVTSDQFGYWSIELPRNRAYRFVFGDGSRVIKTPDDQANIHIDKLQPFQPKDIVRRDSWGYPLPNQDLYAMLKNQLTERQALAVLQSNPVTQILDKREYVFHEGGDGAQVFVHEQAALSTAWIIAHGQDCWPVVSLMDDEDQVMEAELEFPDRNTVIATFQESVRGRAILVCGNDEIPLQG
jgi:hypothetical protein